MNKNGITLIALVVTVIILLIIAAVSVSLVNDNGGLFNKASTASNEHTKQAIIEDLKTKILYANMDKPGGIGLQDVANVISSDTRKEYLISTSIDMDENPTNINDSIYVVIKNQQFKIDRNMNVEYIGEFKNGNPNPVIKTSLQKIESDLGEKINLTLEDILTSSTLLTKVMNQSNQLVATKFINYLISDTTYSMPLILGNEEIFKTFTANAYVRACIFGNENIEKNDTWYNAITSDASLRENVNIDGLVPPMTSNTSPSGKITSSAPYTSVGAGYYAFDGSLDTVFCNKGEQGWILYEFPEPVSVYKIEMKGHVPSQYQNESPKDFKIQGSNDGTTFTDLGTFTAPDYTTKRAYFSNDYLTKYKFIKFEINSAFRSPANTSTSFVQYYSLQVEGIEEQTQKYSKIGDNEIKEILANVDVYLIDLINSTSLFTRYLENKLSEIERSIVPPMTSNTSPSGKITSSAPYTSVGAGYYAFDGSLDTVFCNKGTEGWIMYEFPEAINVYKFEMKGHKDGESTQNQSPKDFSVQGSNDGINFVDLGTFTAPDYTTKRAYYLNKGNEKYKFIRFNMLTSFVSPANNTISYLQYYTIEN